MPTLSTRWKATLLVALARAIGGPRAVKEPGHVRNRASPSRRAYILKADGRQRPLGIATLEDKIVQRAVVEVLNAVYEVDFPGFSYGFRPGRGPHQALDALAAGIMRKRVNWVLDADIRDFLDAWSHCSFR